jgi:tetratricopeptide (TPR) repeat protein
MSRQTVASPQDLRGRADRAIREGRTQQALDLVKTLYRHEPTAEHRELVRQAYLARGRDLRERGAERDSLIVLKAAAESQGDDPGWLVQLAPELAISGGIAEALAMGSRIADAGVADRVLGHVADAGLRQGAAGRALLPESFHADFDRIVQAIALSESEKDDAAREQLAGIGLRSPFLEWKLLIRGLLAYYAGDDVRALENWQRLSVDRLPARLAAPLRHAIDPAYRTAQPAPTQALLQEQFDRLNNSLLTSQLRTLRSALADKDNLAPAFRQAETLLPELRRAGQGFQERLARVFYWAITETGPDDVPRYQRVFGRLPADPQFNRLQALAYDRNGDFAAAHKYWQKYEKEIADDPAQWPAGQAAHARALIWVHIGDNAAMIPPAAKLAGLPHYLRDLPGASRPLKPSADQCYLRATQLAPDLLEAYESLFNHYCREGNDAKATAAARRLLKQFPEHVPTLDALGDLCADRDEQLEALELYKRAMRSNPLDRELRAKTARTHLAYARLLAVEKQIDEARRQVEAARALQGGTFELIGLCRSAAIELKAGETARAEELLAQARQQSDNAVVAYRMMTEVARLKLAKPLKTRFEAEFNELLAGPLSSAMAAHLAQVAAGFGELSYVGKKTHQQKVLAYVDRTKRSKFTETDLKVLCQSLLDLDASRLAAHFIRRGEIEFPANPHFPYMDAAKRIQRNAPGGIPAWEVQPLLQKAERLARALPATEELQELLADIDEKLKALAALDPFGGGMFDTFFDSQFEDDSDDDLFGDDFED